MSTKTIVKIVVGLVLFVFLLMLNPVVIIGAGQRGVVFNNGSGIENRILGEGIHLRIPFVESVTKISVQTQKADFDEHAGTSDSQIVDVKIAVNWHLDPARVNSVYQKVGDLDAINSKVLTNSTQDAVKAATSKYVALDIQRNRDNVAAKALELLQAKVKGYDIIIDGLSITNIDFSGQFNQAVENAQKANQDAIAAENHVKQVEAEAKAAIAKAQGEAEAQKEVQQSLTPELLQKMLIEKWDGHYPASLVEGGAGQFILPLPSK